MNETLEAPKPAGASWWARLPLGLLALAGLTALVADRPSLPATAWAPIKHNPSVELRETLLLIIWLLFVLICLTLWRSVLRPERREASLSDPAAPPRPRRSARPRETYVPPSRELLAIFATPRLTASPARPDPQSEVAASAVEALAVLPGATVADHLIEPRMLRLFGPLRLDGADQGGLRQHPTRGLIAYLVIKRGPATLDELLHALWPEQPTKLTRPRLWKAKQQAAAVVGEALQRRHDRYQLDRNMIHCDTDEIERLLRGDPDPARLEQALTLMQGEPLADIDYPWAENERRRLQALRAETLAQAGSARLDAGDPSGALNAAEQLIELDALNERGWHLAMQAEAGLGRRQAILDRYQQLTRELDDRLGLRPSTETRDTYHRLLSQDRRVQPSESGVRAPAR